MKSIASIVLPLAILLTPLYASAVYTQQQNTGYTYGFVSTSGNFFGPGTCTGYIGCLADTIIGVINGILLPVLFAVALKYIFSTGDATKVAEGHKLILWGLVAFVVMLSLWGLVNVVANTFGLQGAYAPPYPDSYPP